MGGPPGGMGGPPMSMGGPPGGMGGPSGMGAPHFYRSLFCSFYIFFPSKSQVELYIDFLM